RQLANPFGEGSRRFGIETPEDHRTDRCDRYREEPDGREVAGELLTRRRPDEVTVGREAPGMVRTLELPAAVAVTLREHGAAVRADVQETAHLAVVAAHDHDRARADRRRDEVAGGA